MDANMDGLAKYNAKSVLLTGGCGFIGSHVVERLVQNYPDMNVVVMDKLDYCGTLKNLENVVRMKNFHFVKVGEHRGQIHTCYPAPKSNL